jgi:PilZ domain
VTLGLAAPAAVPVEVRAADRRVFRLSQEIGPGGLRLQRPAPFEPGRPVVVLFALPGDTDRLELEAEVATTGDPTEQDGEQGGLAIYFREPPPETRAYISAYVADRLGLPPLP